MGLGLVYSQPSSDWATFGPEEEKKKEILDLKGTFLDAQQGIFMD